MTKLLSFLKTHQHHKLFMTIIASFLTISLLVLCYFGYLTYVYKKSLNKTYNYNYNGINISVEEISRSQYESEINPKSEEITYTVPAGTAKESVTEIHDKEWLEANLYRAETFKEQDSDTYVITLVNVEPASEFSFTDLRKLFMNTPYTDKNHYALADGVNCQGMVCFIADWCKKNNHSFVIEYYDTHLAIRVKHNQKTYRFNFTPARSIETLEE